MPDESLRMRRAGPEMFRRRPVMVAIAGDRAAGKTTLTRGLVEALGPERCVSMCTDDHHRYDRAERKDLPFTALHPDCNYLEIMEQHLQLLASGRLGEGRSEPLAIAQLLLLYQLMHLSRSRP